MSADELQSSGGTLSGVDHSMHWQPIRIQNYLSNDICEER